MYSFDCIKWHFNLKHNTPSCDVIHQLKGQNLISVKEAVVEQNPGTQVKLVGLAVWPRGPPWPRWVCFSFSFSPRLSTSLLSSAHLPSGVPRFPWPCAPSSQASPWTRKCLRYHTQFLCLCVRACVRAHRTVAGMQLKSRGLWTGVAFTFDPWKVLGNAKHNSTFLCAAGSVSLSGASQSACDKGQIRVSDDYKVSKLISEVENHRKPMINMNTWFRLNWVEVQRCNVWDVAIILI